MAPKTQLSKRKKGLATLVRKSRKRPTLKELVNCITPKKHHAEIDWGAPRGKEV